MNSMTKKPLQVYLRAEQLDALRALAARRNTSLAELVREGVDKVLAEEAPAEDPLDRIIGMFDSRRGNREENEAAFKEDPLWRIVGMGDSGLGDLAEKHDEYLAKWTREDNG